MPVGGFLSDQLSTRGSGFASAGSITGTGAPSNPRWAGPGPSPTGSTTMTNAGPRYAGGSGFSEQGGAGQYPAPIGPSATMPGSIAQYPNAIFNPQGGTGYGYNSPLTGLGGLTSLAQSMYGPQQQILADQLARQQDQLGLIGLDVDYKTDALHRDTALSKQLLGLDRQSLGLERGLVGGQLGNLSRLRDILAQRRGIAGEVKGNTLGGLKIDETVARDMAGRKTFDLRSDLTARGAFNTVANDRGTGRIQRDLNYELGKIGLARDAADITYRNTLLGLNEQGISYDNQELGLRNKLANIGLDSQRLGIQEQQLENALADGLHNIGMGGMVSINGLLDAIGGTNTQQAALATEILNAVIGYSSLPPDVIAQITKALGGSAPTGSHPIAQLTPEQRGIQ
jgi:hypothetical protein